MWIIGALAVAVGVGLLESTAARGVNPMAATLNAVQPPGAVQRVTPPQRAGAAPGEKGATYYSLEAQTSRLTTTFRDGTQSIAERNIDGTVQASLKDASGNEVHRIRIDRGTNGTNMLTFARPANGSTSMQLASDVHATLDWANHQAHVFYSDHVAADAPLKWSDGLVRAVGAPPLGASRLDDDVYVVHTEWLNGLAAKTTRTKVPKGVTVDGRAVTGDVLTTKLLKNGIDIGGANYLIDERVYSWHLQGVPDGWIGTGHLQPKYGGWAFTPDLIWMNLQTIATYHWRTTMNAQGTVAQNRSCPVPPASVTSRVANFFAPTVHANDAGCDDLHWLDGTIFRYCCDVHDYCYEKYGCSSSSWWRWFSSWTCDYCNMNAVWCFAGGAGVHPPFVPCPC
jgi:hypothetical protein